MIEHNKITRIVAAVQSNMTGYALVLMKMPGGSITAIGFDKDADNLVYISELAAAINSTKHPKEEP
jgi:hypothetical protein